MRPYQDTTPSGMKTTSADVARWAYELIKLHARIAGRFARPEPHRRALKYLKGLMSQTERKNGWQLAEHAREANPYGMQRLLSRAVWDSDGVRDDVRDYVLEQLGDEQAIGVIDETSFLKQGDKSAGVAVQYCGSTGEVQNCQVAVFLAYVSPLGHALIDRELYLPQAWTQDRERCREAGIPDAVGFQTKPELAQTMLARLSQAGVVLSWVVADTVYGGNLELRSWLHAHGQAHVVAVPCNEPVGIQTPQGRQLVEVRQVEGLLLLASDWQRLSMSQGTKGPRIFDWACVPILHQWQDDGRHWLLIRRCVADPKQKAYYFVFGPSGTTLQEMVTAIGARWHVEEVFETAKDMGLDHYEVRTWTAWYRHITLVMLAHAFLTSICANARVSVPPPMLREEAPADCPCLYHQQQETPADSTLCKSPNSERRKLDPIVQSAQPHAVQAVLPLCNSPNSTRAEQTSLGAISPSTPPRIMQFPQPHEAQTVLPLCNSPNSTRAEQTSLGAISPSTPPRVVQFSQQQADFPPLIALTVPEVRHLLGHLIWPFPCNADFVLDWSKWRRHHQWLSSYYHTKGRLEAG